MSGPYRRWNPRADHLGRSSRVARRDSRIAYLLLSPAVLLLVFVLGYPLVWELWISFTDFSAQGGGAFSFVGLANYRRAVTDPTFGYQALVSGAYAAVTCAAKLALGVGFALLLSRPFPGRALVFVAVFLPWAYPAGLSVIGWFWALNPSNASAYSDLVSSVRDRIDGALGGGAWALLSVTAFNVWRGGSFMGIFLLAAIRGVPPELFECALLEENSGWRRFWHVTVPVLRPFLALALFLSLTGAFWDLTNVWSLTGGRVAFPVITTQAYWLAVFGAQFGPAAALSLTLVPPLLVVLIVLFRLFDAPVRARA